MFSIIVKIVNFEKIQDEVRKIGTVLISAGAVALALDNPKNPVEPQEAILAILTGVIWVLVGSLNVRQNIRENVK